MTWTPQQIRNLRQRLGWSLPEMARRLGCGTDLIQIWERGEQCPDAEVLNQLRYLETFVEATAEQTRQKPLAERMMMDQRLAQITHKKLLDDGH